jgi:hypothetical protein
VQVRWRGDPVGVQLFCDLRLYSYSTFTMFTMFTPRMDPHCAWTLTY